MPFPPLDPTALTGHLLVLPAEAGVADLERLAVARFPRAAWEVVPSADPPRHTGGARAPRRTAPEPGVLRLSRHTALRGPFAIDRDMAVTLGLPMTAATGYVVDGIAERGNPPGPWGGDRLGLRRAFPEGLPVRDEARTVDWLIAAARRLTGAVRIAPHGNTGPTLLTPEPDAAVDLTVWTTAWLEPEAALAIVRRTLPRAVPNLPRPWTGPPAGIGTTPAKGAEVLTPEQRAAVHAAADEHDLAALANPAPLLAYGAYADQGIDGVVALEVTGRTALPPVVAAQDWAREGAVAYAVTWMPEYEEDLEEERATVGHRVARTRATGLVAAIARDVLAETGGIVTDAMDFETGTTGR